MAKTFIPESISLRQHLTYTCSRLLAYGLPVLYFLVTTSFYLKTYDSAQIKITFVQIGASMLLFIWLAKILVEGRFPFRKADFIFVAPFFAWLISGVVSYLHAPFKMWPLEEALRRFFYIILALITISEMRSEERMARLWRWLFAAALVATGYGLVQYIDSRFFPAPQPGIDPFIWRQAFAHRVFSTFGNPNFYGNFLVIVAPLILATVLRHRGSLPRTFTLAFITLAIAVLLDKVGLGLFGGFDESFRLVYGAAIILLLGLFAYFAFAKTGGKGTLPFFFILFALLFLNLYATETKGAWLGFIAAISATLWLIFEFFLKTEHRFIEGKKYVLIISALVTGYLVLLALMGKAFVVPFLTGEVEQVGFSILWVFVLLGGLAALGVALWMIRRPWNLKKVVYGSLFLFVLAMGGSVLNFAASRLVSVSFRLFTWIATWEMVRTAPILGNGVGSFKAIYPAFRRPQIIALERKSNTETDHAEDEYIEIWQDEGIIGFGIFLWLVITALACGVKQLRWYARLFPPDAKGRNRLLEKGDPRSFEVLGILGAYVGALIHWSVDVSIRFVSSGIFSGLLPGLLVAYARNHRDPIRVEARLPYESRIRLGLAAAWTAVFLYLNLNLVPNAFIQGGDTQMGQIVMFNLLAGLGLWVLMELLEKGLEPAVPAPFQEQYPAASPGWLPFRAAGVGALAIVFVWSANVFGDMFRGDVHHNLAIFFSKNGVWRKSPMFERTVRNFPPDIRERYAETGGALEHYQQVIANNPGFPMARYFTGNVYNDWGSQIFAEAIEAKQKGDDRQAERLLNLAFEKWDAAEAAYEGTKALGPNYVQVHHQVGLVYLKRAQAMQRWGNQKEAVRYFEKAVNEFDKYRMIDPVFPPNYHRLVEILMMKGDYYAATQLYKDALYYNDVVAKQIYEKGFPDRVAELAMSLGRLYYVWGTQTDSRPFADGGSEKIKSAVTYLEKSVEADPKNVDALKTLGRVYAQLGRHEDSQAILRKAHRLAPNDPELKSSAGRS